MLNPPEVKRWQLYILPQYLASLTQPIRHKENQIFTIFAPVFTRFEDFITFLYVFMNVVKVFVREELWVNVSVAIIFPTKD